MKRLSLFALMLFAISCVVGCSGGSGPAAPVTSQDELAKWNAENPAPPETPVD